MNLFGIILKKELLDIFRDRRSLMMAIILPLVLYPVMFTAMKSFMLDTQKTAEEQTTVACPRETDVTRLTEILQTDAAKAVEGNITFKQDTLTNAFESGSDANLFAEFVQTDGKETLHVVYDETKSGSMASYNVLQAKLTAYVGAVQAGKLAANGIDLAALAPFVLDGQTLSDATDKPAGGAGFIVVLIVPMILVIYLAVGGMPTAVDLFAGEKERRTFEPLLCTKARRTDILSGKWAAVVVMTIISAAANIGGMVTAGLLNPEILNLSANGAETASNFSISPGAFVLAALAIVLLAVVFTGIHVMLATYARTVKEATTYGSFIMLAAYVPMFSTLYTQGGDFTMKSAPVPLINVIGCLKMILSGVQNLPYMCVTLVSTAVLAGLVLFAGQLMFRNENIMFRG